MTLPEFKAWFEGFTESMSAPPNKKQWERIQERVGQITGQAISYPVYIDRYVRPLQPYWGGPYNGLGGVYGSALGIGMNANATQAACLQSANNPLASEGFNSCNAMAEVGRADARAVTA